MPPPTTITTAIAMPVRVSTMGIITWENFDARRCARRLSFALSSKSWKLTDSRPISWMVRTPCTFSASAPFTIELVSRARRKARLAWGSHTMRTASRTGTTERVSSPSSKSSASSTVTMPTRSTKSPIAKMEVSRNSCRALTSPWSRDISRPTSVLSMKESETFCRCPYIARRRSKSRLAEIRPTTISWMKLAA